MFVRPLLPLLRLVLVVAAVLLLIDALLFRSGFYYAWIEPQSTSGSLVSDIMAIKHYRDPARKNILVLGNSQIGEGFSESVADAASGRGDLHFVNGAVAGTTPRVWNYLLREIDPRADRFTAVALMVDYDVSHNPEDLGNYPLDTSYLVPLLRATDVVDYPASFSDTAQRQRARRAILFPLQILQDDVLDFARHPLDRIDHVDTIRPVWIAALALYPGRDGALPELKFDAQSGMPSNWSVAETNLKTRVETYLHGLRTVATPQLQERNSAYLRHWLGAIVEHYRSHRVPVIVFVVPRGPWQSTLSARPIASGAVAELVRDGRLLALPGDAFVDLEQPQYFFDTLHMNHAGREKFSGRFAQLVAHLVR